MEILVGIIVIAVVIVWFKSKSSGGSKPGMRFTPAKAHSDATSEFRALLDQGKSLVALGDQLPFGINYMKSEQPIIAVENVSFIRNRSEYIAGNAGVSVRVMKGVNFRTGGTKGRRIETPHVLDKGTLVATTKCFYFIGDRNTAKYPYQKLMMCRIDRTGKIIELTKNTSNAKTEYFEHGVFSTSNTMEAAYFTFEYFAMNPDAGSMSYSDDLGDVLLVAGDHD